MEVHPMARFITTLVVIVVVVGVVMAATGVMRFHDTKDESIITIDKKELKEKVQGMATEAKKSEGKVLEKTSDALHKAAERLHSPTDDHDATAKPSADNHNNQRSPDAGKPAPSKDDLDRQP
jgi:hypothetical protein